MLGGGKFFVEQLGPNGVEDECTMRFVLASVVRESLMKRADRGPRGKAKERHRETQSARERLSA